MPANSLNDLFVHELGDIYDAEQQILSTLDQIEGETKNDQVRDRVREHRDETQQQIQNLEECFDMLGSSRPTVECTAVRGLRDEKTSFSRENPSPEALEVFNLDAANKTEHYEVAAYRGLIDQANALGRKDIGKLLKENCRQEEKMSKWIEDHQPKILGELKKKMQA